MSESYIIHDPLGDIKVTGFLHRRIALDAGVPKEIAALNPGAVEKIGAVEKPVTPDDADPLPFRDPVLDMPINADIEVLLQESERRDTKTHNQPPIEGLSGDTNAIVPIAETDVHFSSRETRRCNFEKWRKPESRKHIARWVGYEVRRVRNRDTSRPQPWRNDSFYPTTARLSDYLNIAKRMEVYGAINPDSFFALWCVKIIDIRFRYAYLGDKKLRQAFQELLCINQPPIHEATHPGKVIEKTKQALVVKFDVNGYPEEREFPWKQLTIKPEDIRIGTRLLGHAELVYPPTPTAASREAEVNLMKRLQAQARAELEAEGLTDVMIPTRVITAEDQAKADQYWSEYRKRYQHLISHEDAPADEAP